MRERVGKSDKLRSGDRATGLFAHFTLIFTEWSLALTRPPFNFPATLAAVKVLTLLYSIAELRTLTTMACISVVVDAF